MINQIPSSKGCHVPDSVLDDPPTCESGARLCPQVSGIRESTSALGANWEWLEATLGVVALLHRFALPRSVHNLLRPCSFSYGNRENTSSGKCS